MLAKGPDGVGVIGVRVGIRHADDDRPEGAVVASAGVRPGMPGSANGTTHR